MNIEELAQSLAKGTVAIAQSIFLGTPNDEPLDDEVDLGPFTSFQNGHPSTFSAQCEITYDSVRLDHFGEMNLHINGRPVNAPNGDLKYSNDTDFLQYLMFAISFLHATDPDLDREIDCVALKPYDPCSVLHHPIDAIREGLLADISPFTESHDADFNLEECLYAVAGPIGDFEIEIHQHESYCCYEGSCSGCSEEDAHSTASAEPCQGKLSFTLRYLLPDEASESESTD